AVPGALSARTEARRSASRVGPDCDQRVTRRARPEVGGAQDADRSADRRSRGEGADGELRMRIQFQVAAAACGLFAQTAPAPLSFEVASIKPSAPPADGRVFRGVQFQPGGGFRASNVTLQGLVTFAYQVRDFQIAGGPAWMNSEAYDIQARSPSGAAPAADPRSMTDEQRKSFADQMDERLRSLLADRFQLVVHHETKEAPVYALV